MPPVSFKSSSICRAPGASSCVSHFLVNLPVLQAQQHQGLLPGSLNTQSDLTPVPVGTLAAPRVRCCWGQLRPPEPGTHLQPSGDTGWWASSQPTAVAGLQLSSAPGCSPGWLGIRLYSLSGFSSGHQCKLLAPKRERTTLPADGGGRDRCKRHRATFFKKSFLPF